MLLCFILGVGELTMELIVTVNRPQVNTSFVRVIFELIRQIKVSTCVKSGSRYKRHIPRELRQCLPGTECSAPQGLAQPSNDTQGIM